MIRPDDEDKPFVARWNSLIRSLLVESSVKLVARTAMDYADLYDGTGCHPSNERLARETGYSERTVRTAWGTLRGLDLADRVSRGVAHKREADEYDLIIPDGWVNLPLLGPRSRKFTCLNCGKVFIPQGNSELHKDGGVRFNVRLFVFCPPPRATKGREEEHCFKVWDHDRRHAGDQTWAQLGKDVWKLFQQARGDSW